MGYTEAGTLMCKPNWRQFPVPTLSKQTNNNPCCELGEVELFGTQAISEERASLGLIVRFDELYLSDEDWTSNVKLKLKRAYIKIDGRGCTVEQEGRAGDRPRPQSVKIDSLHHSERLVGRHRKLGADLIAGVKKGIPTGDVAFEASLGAKRKTDDKTDSKYKSSVMRDSLRAAPGNRWVIEDLLADELSGRYSPEDDLCSISFNESKNTEISASLYFIPSDMSIEYNRISGAPIFSLNGRPSTAAVVKALIAKYLKSLEKRQMGTGKVVIGFSSVKFDK